MALETENNNGEQQLQDLSNATEQALNLSKTGIDAYDFLHNHMGNTSGHNNKDNRGNREKNENGVNENRINNKAEKNNSFDPTRNGGNEASNATAGNANVNNEGSGINVTNGVGGYNSTGVAQTGNMAGKATEEAGDSLGKSAGNVVGDAAGEAGKKAVGDAAVKAGEQVVTEVVKDAGGAASGGVLWVVGELWQHKDIVMKVLAVLFCFFILLPAICVSSLPSLLYQKVLGWTGGYATEAPLGDVIQLKESDDDGYNNYYTDTLFEEQHKNMDNEISAIIRNSKQALYTKISAAAKKLNNITYSFKNISDKETIEELKNTAENLAQSEMEENINNYHLSSNTNPNYIDWDSARIISIYNASKHNKGTNFDELKELLEERSDEYYKTNFLKSDGTIKSSFIGSDKVEMWNSTIVKSSSGDYEEQKKNANKFKTDPIPEEEYKYDDKDTKSKEVEITNKKTTLTSSIPAPTEIKTDLKWTATWYEASPATPYSKETLAKKANISSDDLMFFTLSGDINSSVTSFNLSTLNFYAGITEKKDEKIQETQPSSLKKATYKKCTFQAKKKTLKVTEFGPALVYTNVGNPVTVYVLSDIKDVYYKKSVAKESIIITCKTNNSTVTKIDKTNNIVELYSNGNYYVYSGFDAIFTTITKGAILDHDTPLGIAESTNSAKIRVLYPVRMNSLISDENDKNKFNSFFEESFENGKVLSLSNTENALSIMINNDKYKYINVSNIRRIAVKKGNSIKGNTILGYAENINNPSITYQMINMHKRKILPVDIGEIYSISEKNGKYTIYVKNKVSDTKDAKYYTYKKYSGIEKLVNGIEKGSIIKKNTVLGYSPSVKIYEKTYTKLNYYYITSNGPVSPTIYPFDEKEVYEAFFQTEKEEMDKENKYLNCYDYCLNENYAEYKYVENYKDKNGNWKYPISKAQKYDYIYVDNSLVSEKDNVNCSGPDIFAVRSAFSKIEFSGEDKTYCNSDHSIAKGEKYYTYSFLSNKVHICERCIKYFLFFNVYNVSNGFINTALKTDIGGTLRVYDSVTGEFKVMSWTGTVNSDIYSDKNHITYKLIPDVSEDMTIEDKIDEFCSYYKALLLGNVYDFENPDENDKIVNGGIPGGGTENGEQITVNASYSPGTRVWIENTEFKGLKDKNVNTDNIYQSGIIYSVVTDKNNKVIGYYLKVYSKTRNKYIVLKNGEEPISFEKADIVLINDDIPKKGDYIRLLSKENSKIEVKKITLDNVSNAKRDKVYTITDKNGKTYSYFDIEKIVDGDLYPPFGTELEIEIRSAYGPRNLSAGNTGFHGGIDLGRVSGSTYGCNLYAPFDGSVTKIGIDGYGGHYIKMKKKNSDVYVIYRHLVAYSSSTVAGLKDGDSIKKGTLVGQAGNTGFSTGPHLHYEVYVNDVRVNPLEKDKNGKLKYIALGNVSASNKKAYGVD